MSTQAEATLVALLREARRSRRLIDRLPDDAMPRDEDTAYRVAARIAEESGLVVGAWKIGATAPDNLRDLGATQPIYGRIAREAIHGSPCRLKFDELMTPVDECEFAFVLAEDMPAHGTGWTAEAAADRVGTLHPAIEVGERRIARGSPLPIHALIADDSAAGHLVLGNAVADWRRHDLAAAMVRLDVDGREERIGHGRDVLGHPLNALAWLANQRAMAGQPLRAGDVVTTGSCTGMMPVGRASRHVADFGILGKVEVVFD